MSRTSWLYVVLAIAVGAGGWFYVRHYAVTQLYVATPTQSSQPVAQPAQPSDEELNRRRQQGIGSIKELRPVPLEPKERR